MTTVTVTPTNYDGVAQSVNWGIYIFEYQKFTSDGTGLGKNNVTMGYNGDGTFSTQITSEYIGTVEYTVYFIQNWTYCAYVYDGSTLSGDIKAFNSYDTIAINWGNGVPYPNGPDVFSVRFLAKVTAPATATYTIRNYRDDAVKVYINNVLQSNDWYPWVWSTSFTIDLVAGTIYDFDIEYADTGGGAFVYLFWTYGGNSEALIPGDSSSTVLSTEVIGQSPYVITVLPPICGDGKQYNLEEWDDGNTKNSDGCSSSCKIESEFVCTNGTPTAPAKCIKWSTGYTPNEARTQWVYNLSISMAILIIIALGATASLSSVLLIGASMTGIFGFANLIQMILLLPMLAKYMPYDVVIYIWNLWVCLFNFSFLTSREGMLSKWSNLDYDQSNSYLVLIGMDSGSTFVNIQASTFIIFVIIIWSWLIWACKGCFKKADQSKNNEEPIKLSCWHRMVNKLHKTLVFNIYILFFLENCILFWISSFQEIYVFDDNSRTQANSVIFSSLLVSTIIWMIGHSFYIWCVSRKTESVSSSYYFSQYFSGIRKHKWRRLYFKIYMTRRVLSVLIVVLLIDLRFTTKLSIYTCIQFMYATALALLQVHEEWDQRLNEIINEYWYWVLWILLYFLTTKSDWTSYYQSAYKTIIFVNSLVYLAIATLAAMINLSQKLKW